MSIFELARFRRLLESRRVELARELDLGRERLRIEKSPDSLEQLRTEQDRDLAVLDFENRTKLLQDIDSALQRIVEGTFGICLQCDSPVGARRLAAVPWTPFCIRCQEACDRGDAAVLESRKVLASHAA